MKRFMSVYVAALFLIGLAVLGCNPQAQTKVTKSFVVDLLAGDVKISHDGGNNWVAAEVGMKLAEADILKTGKDSYCDLIVPGRGVFRVSYDSVVSIKTLSEKVEKVAVQKGKLFVNITEKLQEGEDFRVETDTAVLAVRGTVFAVEINDDGVTATVENGTVKVAENIQLADEAKEKEVEDAMAIDVSDSQEVVVTKEHKEEVQKIVEQALKENKDPTEIGKSVSELRRKNNVKSKKAEMSEEERKAFLVIQEQKKLEKVLKLLEEERIRAEKKAAEERRKDEEALKKVMDKHSTGADKYVDPDKKTSAQQDIDEGIADKKLEEGKKKAGISSDASKYVDENKKTSAQEDIDEGAADKLMEKYKDKKSGNNSDKGSSSTGTTGKKKPGSSLLDDLKSSE